MKTHVCPGCEKPGVKDDFLACKWCWYELPADLRRRVWKTFREMQQEGEITEAYIHAVGDAKKFWREHHGENHLGKAKRAFWNDTRNRNG